ncbi:MAG: hypothetical protein QGG42_08325, partial [Phycisphaerae bacterium]|nr:hypothetical protein [Phycisphaerae bacterium]
RVTLVWPDGAIANQWVEVTVLATADTGLAAADVFYFGNAVGETSGDGVIGQAEYDTFKSQFGQRGGVGTLASDFDGDGRVGLRDFTLMRSRFGDEVQSPTVPAPAPPAATAPAPALAPEADLLAESSTTSEAAAPVPLSVAVGEVDLSTPTASPAPEQSVELELTDVLLGEDSGEDTDASLDTDSLLVDVLAESSAV